MAAPLIALSRNISVIEGAEVTSLDLTRLAR